MNYKVCLLTAALALTPLSNVYAMSYPHSKGFSQHIREVNYNPDNVVKVNVKVGVVTLIKLQENERITGKNNDASGIGIGNIAAWELAVRGNNIFIKPKTNNPTTNLIVTTNKGRTYTFLLIPAKTATYVLNFKYKIDPNVILQNKKIAQLNIEKKKRNDAIPCSTNKINFIYHKWGNQELSPNAVWDDGQFTCFAFPASHELPLIYAVNSDGSESLLNTYIKNNITVVHSVNNEYRLRVGDSVLGIESKTIKPKDFSSVDTTIDGYKRVIK